MDKYNLKINKIMLKNGDEYIPNKVNVIIGPNNVGKSKFLKEISDYFYGINNLNYILENIDIKFPNSYQEFRESYELDKKIFIKENIERLRTYSNYVDNWYYPCMQNDDYNNMIINNRNISEFLKNFGSLFISYLGTENRLTMIKSQRYIGENEGDIPNFFTDLYNSIINENSNIFKELSKKVKKLFNKDIEFDAITTPGILKLRVGNDFGYYRIGRNGNNSIKAKFSKEKILDDEGDGIKSFVSTFLSLKYHEKDIILIDEPESFLHPPLARQMGEIIGESAKENKQIFVTTHSSEILKGILAKTKDVNVIRITRNDNKNNIIKLENDILKEIINTPKFRVSKILDGLFCEKVVITESEADEIFYQEFLEKISPQSGVFFTHVNSKNNISKTSKIYNQMNVDNIMIFDFDVIRNNNNEFRKVLKEINLDNVKIEEYVNLFRKIDKFIESTVDKTDDEEKMYERKGKKYHREGIRCLPKELQSEAENMIEELKEKNMLILKNGELETNLEEFGVSYSNNKSKWISEAINFINKTSKKKLENTEIGNFIKLLKKQE